MLNPLINRYQFCSDVSIKLKYVLIHEIIELHIIFCHYLHNHRNEYNLNDNDIIAYSIL